MNVSLRDAIRKLGASPVNLIEPRKRKRLASDVISIADQINTFRKESVVESNLSSAGRLEHRDALYMMIRGAFDRDLMRRQETTCWRKSIAQEPFCSLIDASPVLSLGDKPSYNHAEMSIYYSTSDRCRGSDSDAAGSISRAAHKPFARTKACLPVSRGSNITGWQRLVWTRGKEASLLCSFILGFSIGTNVVLMNNAQAASTLGQLDPVPDGSEQSNASHRTCCNAYCSLLTHEVSESKKSRKILAIVKESIFCVSTHVRSPGRYFRCRLERPGLRDHRIHLWALLANTS
nr:hypothetical protein CFP56_69095 [Quercus suber]